MRKSIIALALFIISLPVIAQHFAQDEINRWKQRAKAVTVIRDKWGVPHIYAKTDADAVFGLLYVQCEDDFPRVEWNYITALGRGAEVQGESELYNDLVTRMLADTLTAISRYNQAPKELKVLMDAFADGINYYLYTHPKTKPALLRRFQPWLPLLFPEGSIGGNKSSISMSRLRAFYEKKNATGSIEDNDFEAEPSGSNGFAVAPARTASGNGILMINPHTTFYFRSEVHAVSEEGLNVYGAVTWGQFFIYQGFNETCGWMHTSCRADAFDEYAEKIVRRNDSIFYQHGSKLLPVRSEKITIGLKGANGLERRDFNVYRTHHGPVVGEQDGRWITFKMLDDPLAAITQSYMRTKSRDINDFQKWMDLRTNTSNGTTFVDIKGNIGYWHGNFIPKRNPSFDWQRPVDGSDPETEWKGSHAVSETVQIINPPNGWIQNCNSTPFTGAGENSPKKENYPFYMAPDAESPRAINAVRLLDREKKFTLDKMIQTAYDRYLSSFEILLPALFSAYDAAADSAKKNFASPVALLRGWDLRSSSTSEATTLAIYWGTRMRNQFRGMSDETMMSKASAEEMFAALNETMKDLTGKFGNWQVKWGDVNRYQRLTGKIEEVYDDTKPSVAVGLASGAFGSLPSFGSQTFQNTKKRYGTGGNSFVCAVEFGKRVKAKSIVTGGQSSDPNSKHFTDQAEGFLTGKFKDVNFYKEDVERNMERKYRPGE